MLKPKKTFMNHLRMKAVLLLTCLHAFCLQATAQAGITASPTRLYFKPGNKQEQVIMVTNPHKDKALEIGAAINDWSYDSLGNNLSFDAGTLPQSCAAQVKVLPGAYFSLAPGETKELRVSVEGVPENKNIPVRTAMLYLTQLNPGDARAGNGAAIKVTVRMGIKIYYTAGSQGKPDMEIVNFLAETAAGAPRLKLYLDNTGSLWLNGFIRYDLLNRESGKKVSLPATEFYSLPGDKRVFEAALPQGLEKGKYTATAVVNYGDEDELKLAELDFNYGS